MMVLVLSVASSLAERKTTVNDHNLAIVHTAYAPEIKTYICDEVQYNSEQSCFILRGNISIMNCDVDAFDTYDSVYIYPGKVLGIEVIYVRGDEQLTEKTATLQT